MREDRERTERRLEKESGEEIEGMALLKEKKETREGGRKNEHTVRQ